MKKSKRSSKKTIIFILTTVILLVIISILLMIILRDNLDKNEAIKDAKHYETEFNKLYEKMKSLENNGELKESTQENKEEQESKKIELTKEIANEKLENYFLLYNGVGDNIFIELTKKNLLKYDKSKNSVRRSTNTNGETVTNVKYTDYKNALLTFISESEFNSNFKEGYDKTNSSGNIILGDFGGGAITYKIEDVIRKSELEYTVKTSFEVEEEKNKQVKEFNVLFKLEKDNYIIDSVK